MMVSLKLLLEGIMVFEANAGKTVITFLLHSQYQQLLNAHVEFSNAFYPLCYICVLYVTLHSHFFCLEACHIFCLGEANVHAICLKPKRQAFIDDILHAGKLKQKCASLEKNVLLDLHRFFLCSEHLTIKIKYNLFIQFLLDSS